MRFVAIAEVAAEQQGLFTSEQALSMGAPTSLLMSWAEAGLIHEVIEGVWRCVGAPHLEHEQLSGMWLRLDAARTTWARIAAGDTAVVSHRSAARLHGLGDLDADIAQFTAPKKAAVAPLHAEVRVARITAAEWTLVAGLPTTTPLRTIADLAADGTDGGHLGGVVQDALDQGLVDPVAAARELGPYAEAYGCSVGRGDRLLNHLLNSAARG